MIGCLLLVVFCWRYLWLVLPWSAFSMFFFVALDDKGGPCGGLPYQSDWEMVFSVNPRSVLNPSINSSESILPL